MNKEWGIFFISFTRYWERNNQNHFYSVEVGNDILKYINKKQVFQIEIDYTTATETLTCLNTTIVIRNGKS